MTTRRYQRVFRSGRETSLLDMEELTRRPTEANLVLLVDTGWIGCSEEILLLQASSLGLELQMMGGRWSLPTWTNSLRHLFESLDVGKNCLWLANGLC